MSSAEDDTANNKAGKDDPLDQARAMVSRHIRDRERFEVAISPDVIKVYWGTTRETVVDVSRSATPDVIEAEIAAQLRRVGLAKTEPH